MCCAIQLVAGFNTARSLLGVVRPRRAAPPRVCRPWTRRRASALLRHRSRACRPPGTDSADTGQPRESTVQTLRSAVMRRVAAGGKLECVFPWLLAPSITVRAGLQKSRAHQAPDRRVPERCRSRVALPFADTLPLLIEARGEPRSACKRFFGAILRANAKDRDFRRRSAATVRCRFRPTGGLFFRSEPIGNSRHRP